MPVTPNEFRSALSQFASGVTIVTSLASDGRPVGITVSAFCSVSLDPPLVLVCVEKITASHTAISTTGYFVTNILGAGQDHISEKFAVPAADKFEGIGHREGIGGVPVLTDSLAALECRVVNATEAGDHSIFVGLVERVSIRDGKPLVYFNARYHHLRHP